MRLTPIWLALVALVAFFVYAYTTDLVQSAWNARYSRGIRRPTRADVAYARAIIPELARFEREGNRERFDELVATAHPHALAVALTDWMNALADVVGGYQYEHPSLVLERLAEIGVSR